ncbi:MAG: alanine--tRNA ligase-related protein, partial [Verrucomicrobia bacterium]|nr:alanine--tRNA ligase-related protein [Verrucomicrobiota bacterium]
MGGVFPEIRAKQGHIEQVIQREEEAFGKTLDDGCEIFENALNELGVIKDFLHNVPSELATARQKVKEARTWEPPRAHEESIWDSIIMDPIKSPKFTQDAFESLSELPGGPSRRTIVTKLITVEWAKKWSSRWDPISKLIRELEKLIDYPSDFAECQERILNAFAQMEAELPTIESELKIFPGRVAFKLSATYGLPIEDVDRLAREAGLTVDMDDYHARNEEHRALSRAAQKKQVIELSQVETTTLTQFIGFDKLESQAKVIEVVGVKDKTAVILDASPLYAEMGGQVGDTGEMSGGGELWTIVNTQKAGDAWLHFLAEKDAPAAGTEVQLSVDRPRRAAIQRHHTVTHLLHWALHEVVSKDAVQKGSYVGPEKLTFDFSSAPLTPQQVADVERLVNERILENTPVTWVEVKYDHIKGRKEIMQFFGEKYGDWVRVVQIGGKPTALDGYSMELCGGTHTRATGEIGLFRIAAESAIAAGIRRIEAFSGLEAYRRANEELQLIKAVAGKVNSPVGELEKKIEALLAQQK